MTAQELNNNFDLIADRVGSPYFTTSEKEYFFNTAQYAIIDDLLYPGLRPGAKENDVFDFHKVRAFEQGIGPLVRTATLTATGAGQSSFTFDQIASATSPTATVYKVINFLCQDNAAVGTTTYNSAKHVRNIQSAAALYGRLRTFNSFTFDQRSAIYTVAGYGTGTSGTTNRSRIEFYPGAAAVNALYQVEFVVNPRPISISGSVNPEIDVMFHNDLLFRALTLAGISTRDAQLAQGAQAMEVSQ